MGLLLVAGALCPGDRPASSASYPQLVALIENNPRTGRPVQGAEELISILPKELRANFTFVYRSRSPHGGMNHPSEGSVSADFPRLVLFSADARLVVAIDGNPDRPGADVVEVIHFDDERAAFELSRFVLPAAVARDPALARKAQANGAANPPECLHCHGDDPRPITDSYPLWPGFYGSVRDTFVEGSTELAHYRDFLTRRREAPTGIYRLLAWARGTSTPPYYDPAKFDRAEVEGSPDALRLLPNTRLGMALTELNRRRLRRKLEASPTYGQYKYGLLAGLLGCKTLPVSEVEIKATREALRAENRDRLVRLDVAATGASGDDLQMIEIGFAQSAAQLRYLASTLAVGDEDWSMALEERSQALFDGILSSVHDRRSYYLKEDFILEMLRGLAAVEPPFRQFLATRRVFLHQGYPFGERLDFPSALAACPLLVKKAREEGSPLPNSIEARAIGMYSPAIETH